MKTHRFLGHLSAIGFGLLISSPAVGDPVRLTQNTTITEADTSYDGAALVIDGAVTVAINGPHAFNSLLPTNHAVFTHSPCTSNQSHSHSWRCLYSRSIP